MRINVLEKGVGLGSQNKFKYHSTGAGLKSGDACKGSHGGDGLDVVVKRGKVWPIVMTRFEINTRHIGTSGNKTESRSRVHSLHTFDNRPIGCDHANRVSRIFSTTLQQLETCIAVASSCGFTTPLAEARGAQRVPAGIS